MAGKQTRHGSYPTPDEVRQGRQRGEVQGDRIASTPPRQSTRVRVSPRKLRDDADDSTPPQHRAGRVLDVDAAEDADDTTAPRQPAQRKVSKPMPRTTKPVPRTTVGARDEVGEGVLEELVRRSTEGIDVGLDDVAHVDGPRDDVKIVDGPRDDVEILDGPQVTMPWARRFPSAAGRGDQLAIVTVSVITPSPPCCVRACP